MSLSRAFVDPEPVADDDGRLVCVSRCTMAVVPKPT
jgi:acyl-coenzyme A thioesterase PaaI-like protein